MSGEIQPCTDSEQSISAWAGPRSSLTGGTPLSSWPPRPSTATSSTVSGSETKTVFGLSQSGKSSDQIQMEMSLESRLSTAFKRQIHTENLTSSHFHDQRLTDKTNDKWTQRSLLINKMAMAPIVLIDLIILLSGTISLGTGWREPGLDTLHQLGVDLQADRHDVTGGLTPGDLDGLHELQHCDVKVAVHQTRAVDGGQVLAVGCQSLVQLESLVKSNEPGRAELHTGPGPPGVFSRVKTLTRYDGRGRLVPEPPGGGGNNVSRNQFSITETLPGPGRPGIHERGPVILNNDQNTEAGSWTTRRHHLATFWRVCKVRNGGCGFAKTTQRCNKAHNQEEVSSTDTGRSSVTHQQDKVMKALSKGSSLGRKCSFENYKTSQRC